MNIQIFGTKKCSDTRKAERFFKERRIQFHFRDLSEKGVSKGELENIKRVFDVEDLIDKEGKLYRKRNLEYITHDIEEAIYLSDRVYIMSARPGRFLDELEIKFSRPRKKEVILSQDFLEYKGRILEKLK